MEFRIEFLIEFPPSQRRRPHLLTHLKDCILGELDLHREPHFGGNGLSIISPDRPYNPLGFAVKEVSVRDVPFDPAGLGLWLTVRYSAAGLVLPQLGVEHSDILRVVPTIHLPV
jgi:hypothetical protein